MTYDKTTGQRLVPDIVVGLGVTGLSVVRHLVKAGVTPMVCDSRQNPPGAEQLAKDFPEVVHCFGQFDADLFAQAKRLVVNPGIAVSTPEIKNAAEQGVEIVGDIELFARSVDKPVIAITGSNGKSTVTTLVGEILNHCGLKAGIGGNIGVPALDLIESDSDVYVLELSSFQLETTDSLKPQAAVVLNVSEDHLDRYDSMQGYIDAKEKIYHHAVSSITNIDDPVVKQLKKEGKEISFTLTRPEQGQYGYVQDDAYGWICFGDKKLMNTRELAIGGLHNVANVLAALALCHSFNLDEKKVVEAIRNFKGLPHRTQLVAEHEGVKWYNDSKATNVGATEAALMGLGDQIILIAGGESKDADLAPLRAVVEKHVKSLILIGRDADLIESVCEGVTDIHHAASMHDAVAQAKKLSVRGDTVLLSPACASFDMFDNYMHRGDVFADAVKEVLA